MKLVKAARPDGALRRIRTARTEKEINIAASKGLFPLVKSVKPSDDIKSKYAVYQDTKSGAIKVVGDFRDDLEEGQEVVIDWTYYYPHQHPSPFAAYLVPKDIEVGEWVYLEDLIEDYVGWSWNQGNASRLDSCEAIWNGADFDIQYNPNKRQDVVG
jgi:hypothetical protein